MRYITPDISDLLFRLFFSLIFLALGAEHLFSDSLLQQLMPGWLPYPRLISVACGVWILFFGSWIALGYRLRVAAFALSLFLLIATFAVHVPGVLVDYPELPNQYQWMWTILQRSNLSKNLCLIGVCLHLLYYTPGKYSVTYYMNQNLQTN